MSTAKFERIRNVCVTHYGEKNACGVIAIALACNVSFGKAHAVCKRQGRKDRAPMTGTLIIKALAELGVVATFTDIPIGTTIGTMATRVPGTYLLCMPGHVTTVIDGIIHDFIGQQSRRRTTGMISWTQEAV